MTLFDITFMTSRTLKVKRLVRQCILWKDSVYFMEGQWVFYGKTVCVFYGKTVCILWKDSVYFMEGQCVFYGKTVCVSSS